MFDLFRSRAKVVRFMLGGLLMMVAISMVVTLIPGWGTQRDTQDQIVAEIGKEALTRREVQGQVQKEMRNKTFPSDMAAVYLPQLIERMVTERALAYQAVRMGFQVTEDEIQEIVRGALPQLFPDGKFVGREVYAAFLAQQNTTIPEFEFSLRRQMLLVKLANLASEGVVVTPAEIRREYVRRNEKVKIDYFALSPESYRSEVTASREEIQADYEKNRPLFRVPEKRSVEILILDEPRIAEKVLVSEGDLRRAYEANQDNFRLSERVKVRHILLKTTDKPQDEIPKIMARAEDLLKQIRAGANFAELARKYSEDTASAAKGGDLDWVVRGQTVKAFEAAAFSLKPKQISNLIKTEYGFHILEVLEREEARLKPLEEVKGQITQELKRQAVFDTMQRLADQCHDELSKAPQQAQQIAARLGVQFVKADKVAYGEKVPELGVNQEFFEAIATLKPGEVTAVLSVAGNKLAVAVLTAVHPARTAELSEVESEIRQRLVDEKVAQLVEQRARELAEKAKAAGADFKKLAQSVKAEVRTTQDFPIDGAADGIGEARLVYQAFLEPVGAVFGPVSSGARWLICKVVSKTPADMSQLETQREALVAAVKSQKLVMRRELFEDSLRAGLMREGKLKIHDDVIKRLIASYRG